MEHRIDQLAARKQPVPGPLPSPDETLEIPARSGVGRGPRRGLRSLRRTLRSRRGRWALVGGACVALLLLALLAAAFRPAPQGRTSPGALVDTFAATPTAPASSGSANESKHSRGQVHDPVAALRAKFPDNPLNHLKGSALHRVTISVSSGGPVLVLGYLVPTGLGSTYGEVKGHPHSWSISERAIGRGYLAAVFVQSDRDGQRVTCRVVVDGKVTDSETTSGSYGRAICLG